MASPVDYTEMVWNKDYHRYIPTKEGIQKALATNLELYAHMFDGYSGDISSEIKAWLEELAQVTMDWIFSETPIDNHPYIEYMFAYDRRCQKLLWGAYQDMARYDIRSGGILVGSQHGVNIERSKVIGLNSIRGRVVIPDGAEKKLRQTGLLTNISLPYTVPDSIYRVEY